MVRVDAGDFSLRPNRHLVSDLVAWTLRQFEAQARRPRRRDLGARDARRPGGPGAARPGAAAAAGQCGEVLAGGRLPSRLLRRAATTVDIAVRNSGPPIPERGTGEVVRAVLSWLRGPPASRNRDGPRHRAADCGGAPRHASASRARPTPGPRSSFPCRGRRASMSAGRILVVDDDPQIRRVMQGDADAARAIEVDDAKNGDVGAREGARRAVRSRAARHQHAGHERARRVPRDPVTAPKIAIIMLTVRDNEADKVEALDAGADDYVTKPFKPPELSARIRAALRRAPGGQGRRGRLALGGTIIDFDTREVVAAGRRVRLTPKEFDLLRYLVAHAEQGPLAPRAAPGSLGARLRRPGGLPPRGRQPTPQEDRADAVQAPSTCSRSRGSATGCTCPIAVRRPAKS